jgi:hypothetical protein
MSRAVFFILDFKIAHFGPRNSYYLSLLDSGNWNRRKQEVLAHIFWEATPDILELLFRKAKEMSDPLGQCGASTNEALERKLQGDHSEEERQVRVGKSSSATLTD